MVLSNKEALLTVLTIGGITFATRALSFWIFPAGSRKSSYIGFLSINLPFAMIGMLIVYCFKNLDLFGYPHGLPELLAGGFVVGAHLLKRNLLLSIIGGTLVYMWLIQWIFR